jgi:predicted transposase YdaD
MKSDKLFHEYFRIAPQALFELLQITPGCDYEFVSPVLKETERRLDGIMRPPEPGYPYYFLETQGYHDKVIYWRALQQTSMFFTQNPDLGGVSWQLVLLFIDNAYDPGPETLGPLYPGSEAWLTRGTLSDLLEAIEHPSPILNTLRPLAATEETIQAQAAEWLTELNQIDTLTLAEKKRMGDLLAQLVVQRFQHMSRQEINRMLQLIPLEETRAGRELIAEGLELGLEQGLEQGLKNSLLDLLRIRFEHVPASLEVRISAINNPAELRELFQKAAVADSLASFEQAI